MYTVFYTSAAARQLRHVPHEVRPRIQYAVEVLADNPRTVHTEKLEGSANAYRIRVGVSSPLYD